jgi:outer membrane receptor protein involved in Fe transport
MTRMIAAILIATCLATEASVDAATGPQTASANQSAIAGVVRDATGRVVPDATIIVRGSAGVERQGRSGPDGRFLIAVPPASTDLVLVVRAGGFAETRQSVASPSRLDVDVVLTPAGITETVTVTPARGEQRTGDVPASVSVLTRQEIKQSPAVVADDVLRQIPTFSLFRRTSSLSSHPTSQGVSLRGIGPSGVSRTLVLLDGVPFNDPFGGWVYWTRVPLESLDRVEVVDSSSSSLYGNYAMGGVINLVTGPAERRTLEAKTQYGSRSSPKIDVIGSDVWGKVGLIVDGSSFRTDGYPIVRATERGRIDNNASVKFHNLSAKLQFDPSDRLQASFRVGYFREERDNGKVSTFDRTEEANDTTWTTTSGAVRVRLPDESALQITVFSDFETFHSNFLAVPAATPARSIGRMTLNQRVPTTAVGGLAQWSRSVGSNQFISAGADWRWVDGDSEEQGLDAQTGTQVTLNRVSGGTQRSVGVFVQDLITPTPRLMLTLSARVDRWDNYNAHNLETSVPSGVPTANNASSLPERNDTVFNPRAAARYHFNDRVSVWGDLGYGFRAPTLNELYRQFRVGTVLTLANNQLGPERLIAGEAGISITPLSKLTWRTTWFDTRVEDPVSNVTISTSGANTTQQRQNLGRTRIRGLQTDAEYRIGSSWRVSGGYFYNRARVVEFAANPALVGKFLAQVPKHRGSVEVNYFNPRIVNVAFGVQAVGRQFDDDLNSRAVPGYTTPGLPKYALMSLTASRPLGRGLEIFFGVQNLSDREYYVGTLPTTIGTPRLVNGGIRVRFAPRGSAHEIKR